MRRTFTIEEIRARSYKARDAWWTVLLVDPLATRLVQLAVRYRWVTPNRLTLAAFGLGLAAAASFAAGDYPWLVAGALLFHLSFVVDCMDGKLARLTGTGSIFGIWLDFVFDQVRIIVCTVALMGGQYLATGEAGYLVAATGVLAVDMLRYFNAANIAKVKREMRNRLAARYGTAPPAFLDELVRELPPGGTTATGAVLHGAIIDVGGDFRARFSLFVRLRNALVRRRIRIHLVSGIEFQMATFVVGPLAGAVILAPAVAGALLLAFEVLLVYKLWLSTRAFEREFAAGDPPPGGDARPAELVPA